MAPVGKLGCVLLPGEDSISAVLLRHPVWCFSGSLEVPLAVRRHDMWLRTINVNLINFLFYIGVQTGGANDASKPN